MVEFKIALYGQVDNDTKFVYTYPDKFNPSFATEKDYWLKSVSDPRDARVFRTERVYALWRNDYGNYYALLVPNKNDSRNGYLILTLFVGRMLPESGNLIVKMLEWLERLIITQEVRDHKQIASALAEFEPMFRPDVSPRPKKDQQLQKAFRRYHSQAEMEELLLYNNQKDYPNHARILLVPADAVPAQLSADYKELTAPVTHNFFVEKPQGEQKSGTSQRESAKQRQQRRLTQLALAVGLFVAGFLVGRSTAPEPSLEPVDSFVIEKAATDSVGQHNPQEQVLPADSNTVTTPVAPTDSVKKKV